MMTTTVETISPEIANEYLKLNKHTNRPLNKRHVDTLVREMQRGNFLHTHQGIAFDEDGDLFDGQHRLTAIVRSGVPVTMNVTRGVDNKCMLVSDRGVSRSMRDVMVISGGADKKSRSPMCSAKVLSGINQLVRWNYRPMRLSASDQLAVYEALESTINQVYRRLISSGGYNAGAQMIAAAMAACENGVDIDSLVKFFDIFYKDDVYGCVGANVNAPLNLRRQVDSAKAKHMNISRRCMFTGAQNAIYHFVNNTDTTQIGLDVKPRYDMRQKIAEILDLK